MTSAVSKDSLRHLVQSVENSGISTIKTIVSGVLEIINNPNATALDLKKIIEIDPPLTVSVLRSANSAYYSPRSRISDIKEAIICIGFDALKELALRQKVCDIFHPETNESGFSRKSLWKHSVAVAIMSKMIFRKELGESGENIYTAGLLHDIGLIAEDQFMHEAFTQIVDAAYQANVPIQTQEKSILGFDHALVAKSIFDTWQLPPDIGGSVWHHHDVDNASTDLSQMACVLALADHMTQVRGLGYSPPGAIDSTQYQKSMHLLKLTPFAVELIADEMQAEITRMEEQGIL